MLDALAQALSDPMIRDWYLMFCMAVMFVPIIAIAVWYHANIGNTEGGRKLMEWQSRKNTGRLLGPGPALRNARDAGKVASDISDGRYGSQVKTLQNRVYGYIGLWLVANIIAFSILIWADEVNRVTG